MDFLKNFLKGNEYETTEDRKKEADRLAKEMGYNTVDDALKNVESRPENPPTYQNVVIPSLTGGKDITTDYLKPFPNASPEGELVEQQVGGIFGSLADKVGREPVDVAARMTPGATLYNGVPSVEPSVDLQELLNNYYKKDAVEKPAEKKPIEQKDERQIAAELEGAPPKEELPAAAVEEASLPPVISKRIEEGPRYSFLDRLKEAQEERRQGLDAGLIASGGEDFNAALTGYTPKTSLSNYFKSQADLGVQEITEDLNAQKTQADINKTIAEAELTGVLTNPNSPISVAARQAASKAGINIPEGVSAQQLQELGLLKNLLGGSQSDKKLRFETIFNPQTGQSEIVGLDPITGETVKNAGVAGFAPMVATNPYTGDRGIISRSDPKAGKDFFTQREATGAGDSSEPASKTYQVYAKLQPEQRKFVNTQTDKYEKEVQESRSAVTSARTVRDILSSGRELKGDILRAIQNQLARATGEVGVMTDKDVAPFGGRADIVSQVNRTIQNLATGQLPESDRQFLMRFSTVLENAGQRVIQDKSGQYVERIRGRTNLPLEESKILLGIDAVAMSQAVKIRNKDTGDIKTLPISKASIYLEDSTFEEVK